ncbi:MAG: glycosyltransferase involved in cell wall biosynthesis [Planctomycetota bacterium]
MIPSLPEISTIKFETNTPIEERPLRIALLVDPLTMGTKGGDHAPEIARELLSRGHQVRGFGAAPGAIPHSSDEPTDSDTPGLLSWKPDVLVAYDALSPTAWLGARIARKLDAGLVLVESGIEHPRRMHERALQAIGERLWGRFVRRTANVLIALDQEAERLALAEGFPQASIQTVTGGVDLERFRPGLSSALIARHRIRGRILSYIGRLEDARGVNTLLHAFATTVGQRSDWSLVLSGEGEARVSLRAAADRLGVSERVHFLGRLRQEELPGLLGGSTLLAVPTLTAEVRGKQIIRAMSCGIPVLASDNHRLRSYVNPEETGLLAKPGSAEEWKEIMQRAAGSPVARERWGQQAREQAVSRFGWASVAERFEHVLIQAIRSQASVRSQINSSGAIEKT